jgi:hypothetical protein
MANKILTYVDASVLIYGATKPTAVTFARRLRALQVLGDPEREFVASEYLRLEVLPIASYFNKKRETAFHEKFFDSVTQWVDAATLVAPAYSIARQYGLGALDALHLDVTRGLFSFNEETHVAKIRREESIIRFLDSALHIDVALNFYFLLVRVSLVFVIYVPAKRHPKLINKVLTHILLRVGVREVCLFMFLKVRNKFANARQRYIEFWLCHVR